MITSIFYKEWIKTRWVLLLALVISLSFVVYGQMRIARVLELKGAVHLWEIILTKDVIFIEFIKYMPLLVGVLIGVAQYVPETQQKRLKLTLHLPVSQKRIIATSTLYGVVSLFVIFLLNYFVLWLYLQQVLVSELVVRIFWTVTPWYIAGVAGYAFAAWICIEPTWRYRFVHALFAVGFIRLLFLVKYPESYNGVLWIILLLSLLFLGFVWISTVRFKLGKQD